VQYNVNLVHFHLIYAEPLLTQSLVTSSASACRIAVCGRGAADPSRLDRGGEGPMSEEGQQATPPDDEMRESMRALL
jgi:hypothetical protein